MSRSGILVVALVFVLACQAQAVSTWTQLNPKNINDQHLAFTFTTRNQGQVLEFQVTIHRKSGELSPFLQAHLEINDGDQPVANCPVAAYRHDHEVTYTFQVSPKYLEKSKFLFAEMAYVKMKDEQSQEKLMPMPAGDFFWFYLSDFAPAGTTRPTTQVGQAPDLEIRIVPDGGQGMYYNINVLRKADHSLLQTIPFRNGLDPTTTAESVFLKDIKQDGRLGIYVLGGEKKAGKWYNIWAFDPKAGQFIWLRTTEPGEGTRLKPQWQGGSGPAGRFDATKTAADFANRIKPQLPDGWSVAVEQHTVTVACKNPVEWYSIIGLPAVMDKADLKTRGFVQSGSYTITVEFGPPLTPDEVTKLLEENRKMIVEYEQKHPTDLRAKPVGPPKELTEKLHRIPNVLASRYSAVVTPFVQGSMRFYSGEDEAECRGVEQSIHKALDGDVTPTRSEAFSSEPFTIPLEGGKLLVIKSDGRRLAGIPGYNMEAFVRACQERLPQAKDGNYGEVEIAVIRVRAKEGPSPPPMIWRLKDVAEFEVRRAVPATQPATEKPSVRLELADRPEGPFQQILGKDKRYEFVRVMKGAQVAKTGPVVLVHDVASNKWKRITEVSLKNAKLGRSPRTVSVMWDFSESYRGKEYAPVPLRTGRDGVSGYPVLPEKVELDAARAVYIMWFTAETGGGTEDPFSTWLEIRRMDLDEAFEHP